MTRTQGDLAALSKFVFRAPDWSASLFFTLVVAAVVGVATFDSQFFLDDAYRGMVYIGVPTVVAAFLTPPIDRRLGGQFTYNRSALLAFVCEIIVVAFLIVAAVVAAVGGFGQSLIFDALLVSLASIFALRLFVITAVSRRSLFVTAIPASIQTAVAAVLIFVYSGTVQYMTVGGPLLEAFLARSNAVSSEFFVVRPADFALLAALCGLYALAVAIFLFAIDRPWRRSLGVSVLDFIQGFVGHVAEGSRELETFFEKVGETATVPVTVLVVRRPDGTEKAQFVLPMVHPGPMGEIGGGNLPERIAADTDGLAFPPHATADHDFNLVTEREVDTLLDAASRARDRIEYTSKATRSDRVTAGDSKLLGQAIGEDAILVATHAPEPADDVDFSVGLATAAEARRGGLDEIMLVDAHNCNDGMSGDKSRRIAPGSKRSFDLMAAAEDLGGRLVNADRHPLSVGVAWDETEWEPTEGIGPLGIRVAVFEVDSYRTAYVLLDGNNMEPKLRETLRESIDADESEIMTTDTHVVNAVEPANQIGDSIETDRLVSVVSGLVEDAIADIEPVEAGMGTERAEVTVFGNDRTETLASTANTMVTIGGALLAAIIGAAMAMSLLLLILTG